MPLAQGVHRDAHGPPKPAKAPLHPSNKEAAPLEQALHRMSMSSGSMSAKEVEREAAQLLDAGPDEPITGGFRYCFFSSEP